MRLIISFVTIQLFFSSIIIGQEFYVSGKKITDYKGEFRIDSIPIAVNGLNSKLDTSFGLIKICFNIEHPRVSDLKIELLAPDGSLIWLTNRNGGEKGGNYINICFRSNGFNGYIHQATAPFMGEYVPDGRMAFINNNQNPNGKWYVLVQDLKTGSTGIVHYVKMEFGTNPMPNNDKGGCTEENPELCKCASKSINCDLLPDLVVLPKFTDDQIQEFPQNDPNYPGQLRLAISIANIGDGPFEVLGKGEWVSKNKKVDSSYFDEKGNAARQIIYQRIHQKGSFNKLTKKDIKAGTNYYDNHAGHNHFHVDDWVVFRLVKETKLKNKKGTSRKIISSSSKISYCLWDTGICNSADSLCFVNGKFNGSKNLPNYGLGTFDNCNSGYQGISVGGYDTYGLFYEGQYLTIPKNTKNGEYLLEIEIDPMHKYTEKNKANNIYTKKIMLEKQL